MVQIVLAQHTTSGKNKWRFQRVNVSSACLVSVVNVYEFAILQDEQGLQSMVRDLDRLDIRTENVR